MAGLLEWLAPFLSDLRQIQISPQLFFLTHPRVWDT
jgi:hypothetical protein